MKDFDTVVSIYGREMRLEMEGYTPLEISDLAEQVTQRMKSLHEDTGVVDSSKLALMVCMSLMADLQKAQSENSSLKHVDERRLDAMIESLQTAVG